ncbi:MAG: hypothetical protein ABSD02_13225 [Steroidobacteraceae bacterium]|jgi:hypothetical protein
MRPFFRLASLFHSFAAVSLLAACGGESSIKPSEVLDERTGMTVGTLDKPIELMQGTPASLVSNRRASYAYLGPVEWDNMGNIRYGLWIHVAPGNDWRFDEIKTPGAVSLSLDAAATPLSLIEPPALARAPYQPVASWGETAYFGVDLELLRRMAASGSIGLDVRAGDSVVHFAAAPDAHETLLRYLHARGY